ncbi:MAG: RecX family transcriptional regulator [Bacteroidales bacterium]|nr:RecX family transcriptional regulator [Bacteroidales bacterium]
MSPEQNLLLKKAQHYCAYTERSIFDVKMKLQEWKLSEKKIEEFIRRLEDEDYINEERYAVTFAYGKLRNNKWGRTKIFYALSQKNIPEIYIQMGLNELDEEEYLNTLKSVIASKQVTGKDEFTRQNKLVSYAVQKGFQPDLAWKVVRGEI